MDTLKKLVSCLAILGILLGSGQAVYASGCGGCCSGKKYRDHSGELYAIRVPGIAHQKQLSVDEAKDIVATYRWVYVNASCKTVGEAKTEATKLADAVGWPMVHVYMSKCLTDGLRNDYHSSFMSSLEALLQVGLDGREIMLTARSYGVHQALYVARHHFNYPTFLLTGIAPAFGAFGNEWSDNVARYIEDVGVTEVKYCMIASDKDSSTWNAGGAAYRKGDGSCEGDDDVCTAIDSNSENIHLVELSGANHCPIDEYIDHGLVSALRQCADHFGMNGAPFRGTLPTSWIVPIIWLNLL